MELCRAPWYNNLILCGNRKNIRNPEKVRQMLLFIFLSLLPALVSGGLILLEKKTAFGGLPGKTKQVIFGLVFGGIAVLGTEFGLPYG